MGNKKDQIIRVDPAFKKLLNELKQDLGRTKGKKVSDVDASRFIQETYPKDTVKKLMAKRFFDDDEDTEGWLYF